MNDFERHGDCKQTILITGAASGLGKALFQQLYAKGFNVVGFDMAYGDDVRKPPTQDKLPEKLYALINCAGVNKINWMGSVTEEDWDEMLDTNTKALFFMSQACLPALRAAKGTILNIVSNAAHMPMRSSAAYNTSKGGALILTKQMARELAPHITVFSVSPNKLKGTKMSDDIDRQVVKTRNWTLKEAQKYQCAGLITGEETPVEQVAEFITFLLSSKERHKFLAGCDIQYGL